MIERFDAWATAAAAFEQELARDWESLPPCPGVRRIEMCALDATGRSLRRTTSVHAETPDGGTAAYLGAVRRWLGQLPASFRGSVAVAVFEYGGDEPVAVLEREVEVDPSCSAHARVRLDRQDGERAVRDRTRVLRETTVRLVEMYKHSPEVILAGAALQRAAALAPPPPLPAPGTPGRGNVWNEALDLFRMFFERISTERNTASAEHRPDRPDPASPTGAGRPPPADAARWVRSQREAARTEPIMGDDADPTIDGAPRSAGTRCEVDSGWSSLFPADEAADDVADEGMFDPLGPIGGLGGAAEHEDHDLEDSADRCAEASLDPWGLGPTPDTGANVPAPSPEVGFHTEGSEETHSAGAEVGEHDGYPRVEPRRTWRLPPARATAQSTKQKPVTPRTEPLRPAGHPGRWALPDRPVKPCAAVPEASGPRQSRDERPTPGTPARRSSWAGSLLARPVSEGTGAPDATPASPASGVPATPAPEEPPHE